MSSHSVFTPACTGASSCWRGYESAEPIFQLLTAKARTAEDRITLYNDKATLATGYYSDEEAVRSGLEA